MIGEGITVGGWPIPESELEERFDTSGGPGGQHANRNETAVTIRFEIEGSSFPERFETSCSSDSAPGSRSPPLRPARSGGIARIARERLIQRLEAAMVEAKPRRKTKPGKKAHAERLSAETCP